MAFLYNKFSRRFLLALIVIWGSASFWLVFQSLLIQVVVIIFSVLSLIFIWLDIMPVFLLIFLSFTASYSLYGYLFQFGLPIWLVMLAILIIFGYLYLYNEQKIGILGNQRLIYLLLFSIISMQVFLALNYFFINPVSKSLIMATVSYFFVGFTYTVLAKHEDNSLRAYMLVAGAVIALIFLTSIWSV